MKQVSIPRINVDDLIDKQFFIYKRRFTKNGKPEKVEIRCKIQGLRSEALKKKLAEKEAESLAEDGSITLRISGCQNKIDSSRLKSCLKHWGEVKSEPKEEVFIDPLDNDGTNRTGIYVLKIIPHSYIPELVPIDRLRVRISHTTLALCTGCYEKHLRRNCENEKISWPEYVKKFILENSEIPREFYGNFIDRVKKGKLQKPNELPSKPTMKEFNIPESQQEWDSMITKLQE